MCSFISFCLFQWYIFYVKNNVWKCEMLERMLSKKISMNDSNHNCLLTLAVRPGTRFQLYMSRAFLLSYLFFLLASSVCPVFHHIFHQSISFRFNIMNIINFHGIWMCSHARIIRLSWLVLWHENWIFFLYIFLWANTVFYLPKDRNLGPKKPTRPK